MREGRQELIFRAVLANVGRVDLPSPVHAIDPPGTTAADDRADVPPSAGLQQPSDLGREGAVVLEVLDDLRDEYPVDGAVRELLDVRRIGDEAPDLRRDLLGSRDPFRREVDRVRDVTEEAALLEGPENRAVAGAELRDHSSLVVP